MYWVPTPKRFQARRPDRFVLDRDHYLSDGLVFAMLGNGIGVGTNLAYDSTADFGRIGNHGTLSSGMDPATAWVWSPELNRYQLDLDGTNDYISIQNYNSTGNFSIAYWMWYDGSNVVTTLRDYTSSGGNIFFLNNSGSIYVRVGGNSSAFSAVATYTNLYTHWSMTVSGTDVKVYINGIYAHGFTGGAYNVQSPWYLGRNGQYAEYSKISIADFFLWDRALSAAEVAPLADRSNVTYDGWLQSLRGWVPGMAVAGGGISQAIGQVSETDSQSALSKAKEKAVALQTETDSALAVLAAKSVAIAIQTETDSSSALTSAKSATIALQTETDEALPLGAAISLAIGQVSETDSVFAITSAKEKAIGLVSETDSLFALSTGLQANVAQIFETDSAFAVTSAKTKAIGLQSETDEALSPSPSKAYTIGQASETDSLFALAAKLKSKSIGLVASVELSHAFTTGLISRGVEFRAPDTRLHFRAPDTRLHFRA